LFLGELWQQKGEIQSSELDHALGGGTA
jgi:hypothetical protein